MTEFLHPRDHRADGSAYGRPAQRINALWIEVGPGKPMGELLRRYWHPIALSEQIGDLPRAVKILGEDLVLFRDGKGRAGLVYPRCMHRGTTLLYGKVEERGIRCCYHGWLSTSKANVWNSHANPTPAIRCANASASPGIRSRSATD
jgi:hypothetical protein